jgi:4-amino-4-deoxy-L-arabinose transferase-like glycosyltransferase
LAQRHRIGVGVFGLAIMAITGISLVLRLSGAGWSLPYVDHPDEPAVMNVVLRIVRGDLDPDFFFYPSLMLYIQALVARVYLWWGTTSGSLRAPVTLPETTDFYTTLPGLFLWGRLVTGFCGTLAVLSLGVGGARVVGRRAAAVGAAMLAVSTWSIIHSHYVTVDVPAALFATLAILAACRVLDRGSRGDYVLAGCLCGLAMATSINLCWCWAP